MTSSSSFSLAERLEKISRGEQSDKEIETLLRTLKQRGETHQEITTFARFLRKHAHRIALPPKTVDTCGTGGDGLKTYNISTAVAFVVAACGVPVAKHGGRSVSSRCGSLDVLESLGIPVTTTPQKIERMIAEKGLGFLPAPLFHPVMKHMAQARKHLGYPTIANLAGPLSHPGGVLFQLVGVYDVRWLMPMARSLRDLGTRCAWIVHGVDDGVDEISISGATHIVKIVDDTLTKTQITPEDARLSRHRIKALVGGDRATNAKALLRLLEGGKTGEGEKAYRDAVLLNASGALCIVGAAEDLLHGVEQAREALIRGDALRLYRSLAEKW